MGHPLAAWMGLNSRPGRWWGERPRFSSHAQSTFSPRGQLHDVGVFIPGRAVSNPVFISHLTSVNRAPTLVGASQMVLGTRPSSSVYSLCGFG